MSKVDYFLVNNKIFWACDLAPLLLERVPAWPRPRATPAPAPPTAAGCRRSSAADTQQGKVASNLFFFTTFS